LIIFFKISAKATAQIDPTTMNGAVKSRRAHTAAVCATKTIHFVEAFSLDNARLVVSSRMLE
jgi:predicted solute-binding protein